MSISDNKKNQKHIYYMDGTLCFQRKKNIHVPGRGEEVGRQQPCFGALQAPLAQYVDVIITSQCIHLYILCIVPRCLFQEVSVM